MAQHSEPFCATCAMDPNDEIEVTAEDGRTWVDIASGAQDSRLALVLSDADAMRLRDWLLTRFPLGPEA